MERHAAAAQAKDPIEQIVANLRRWRALPGYSVERRIDLLLTPYLEGFLTARMGAPVKLVTPEFPIPKKLFPELLDGRAPRNQHIAADFLCLREEPTPAWVLVELKTDLRSRRSIQDLAYRAVCAPPPARSDARGREVRGAMTRLLDALAETKRDGEHAALYHRIARVVRSRGPELEPIEVCYIQPRVGSQPRRERGESPSGVVTWTFGLAALATHISPADPFGRLLQQLLRGIARSDKARGVRPPRSRGLRHPRSGWCPGAPTSRRSRAGGGRRRPRPGGAKT